MRRRLLSRLGLAAVIGATAFAVYWFRPETLPETDTLGVVDVEVPSTPPNGVVFLFSDADGFTARDTQMARTIAANGSVVVGIDLKRSFAKAQASLDGDDDCVYFVSDIEELSQILQRSAGAETYTDPVVAGAGAGGAMVLAIAAQSPMSTIGHAVAIDPTESLPLQAELCSGAPHHKTADGKGWIYGLQPGDLPEPVTVVETPDANPAGAAHVADLIGQGFAIEKVASIDRPGEALNAALTQVLAQEAKPADGKLSGLPLAVLAATPRYDTMAIVLSGDGGWRDIDRQLGESLSQAGVPTVGIDSLRYFWTRKPPETIATDLSHLIDHFTRKWNVHHVALIGYSFGADAIPATYDLLQPADKARISVVSLLALSRWAEFEFNVGSWLDIDGDTSHPTLTDVAKIPASIVQCIYGADDDDSVCEQLSGSGVEVIKTDGDHHFDGDYAALADRILARIR